MKKHFIPVLIPVLTAALLAGCRGRQTPIPTTSPVPPAVTAETRPETKPHPTAATTPSGATRETIEDGNGPIPGQTTLPAGESKSRKN